MQNRISTKTYNIFSDQAIFLGDVHFGARNDSDVFKDFQKEYFDDMFEDMRQKGIKYIIQVGDVFDRRKYINFLTLAFSKKYFFDKLVEYDILFICIVGNHDTPYKNTLRGNSLSQLLNDKKYINHIVIIEEPTELTIVNKKGKEVNFLALPWICMDNTEDTFRAIEETESKYCFGHFELEGFEMYKGLPCQEGMDRKVLRKFKKVISGHFHTVSAKHNIQYIGSPYQITWGDYGDPRGYFIFDIETEEFEFIVVQKTLFHVIDYDDTSEDFVLPDDFSEFKNGYVNIKLKNVTQKDVLEKLIQDLMNVYAVVTTIDEVFSSNKEEVVIDYDVHENMTNTFKKAATVFDEEIRNDVEMVLMDTFVEASNQMGDVLG